MHDHDHEHPHKTLPDESETAEYHERLETAVRELLIEDRTPALGARLVARAWLDPGLRARLLEDVARTFSEHGANIVAYGGAVEDGMARNWYTAELGDVKDLRSLITALRNLEGVVDAYRQTPGA